MSPPDPLLPAEWLVVGVMLERLGGKVEVTTEDLMQFSRECQIVNWVDPMTGTVVVELRRPEPPSGPWALPGAPVTTSSRADITPPPEVGSRWIWEKDQAHARAEVEVTEVALNGTEWWVKSRALTDGIGWQRGAEYWNEYSRWLEAVTPAPPQCPATASALLRHPERSRDGRRPAPVRPG